MFIEKLKERFLQSLMLVFYTVTKVFFTENTQKIIYIHFMKQLKHVLFQNKEVNQGESLLISTRFDSTKQKKSIPRLLIKLNMSSWLYHCFWLLCMEMCLKSKFCFHIHSRMSVSLAKLLAQFSHLDKFNPCDYVWLRLYVL